MKKLKTRDEVLDQAYLNKADIQKLLSIGKEKAKRVYELAEEIDSQELEYRIETTKVRMTSVCKVTGIKQRNLRR